MRPGARHDDTKETDLDTTNTLAEDEMTRRELLIQTGATLAGLTLVARPARTATAAPPLILGSGSQRYECLHDWLTPPPHIRWGDTHGVAQDSKGRIYIAHTVHPDSPSGDTIVVYDAGGKYLTSWGERFRGGAHGLDLRKEGDTEYLYHCDIKNRLVVKTTLDGKVIWEKGVPQEPGVYGKDDPFVPTNVAFGPSGDFYVTDGYGSDWIHQYSIKGEWIRTFGGKGKEPGKVLNAHGIWLDDRGKEPLLVVADRANSRLQYFTLDGRHVKFVADGMRQPCHFHTRGDLLLVPDLKSVVTLLDGENKVVASLGDGDPSGLRDHPRVDFNPGKFIHPHSAKLLSTGDILEVEWVPIGRVTLLRKLG
jgi:hypothetical protein